MLDIQVASPGTVPIILTLPFQLGLLSLGLFFLTAFGSLIVTANPVLTIVGIKVSFFDLFVVVLVVFILIILQC